MGRFCIALTYCSYHTFPHTLYLSALRADVDSVYPAFDLRPYIYPSVLPLSRTFRRSQKPQDGGQEDESTAGRLGVLPSLPA